MITPAVHMLPLPTPFAVGDVNAYLIKDDPLTLVDTGPTSARTLIALRDALGRHGLRIADLERIVLTHQHYDHVGLAGILVECSGAEVCALEALAPWLATYEERMEAQDAFTARLMTRHGVPTLLARGLHAVSQQRRAWGAAVEVTRTLQDGEVLPFANRSWRVHHRPGHSPSDTVFHDEVSGELIAGDHLIKHISSNALVTPPLDGHDDATELQPQPLRTYIASLRATLGLDARMVWSGHGEPIDDCGALIAQRLAGHERRAARIAQFLQDGPLTAYAVAERIWGETAVAQPHLVVSEVLGHLDLLVAEGRATAFHGGSVTWFAAAS